MADQPAVHPGILDAKGRCCGRKPMVYKSAWSTADGPHRWCSRCCRAYDLHENRQISSWAWKLVDGAWVRQTGKAVPNG